tara:strand:- start:305 stop:889 length:585 start_codon:yes stop_codon:yes gene_type:complete
MNDPNEMMKHLHELQDFMDEATRAGKIQEGVYKEFCDKMVGGETPGWYSHVKETLENMNSLTEERMRMIRRFSPLATGAIQSYEKEIFSVSYEDLVLEGEICDDDAMDIPESDVPVDISDPICRHELIRVLNDLGYIAVPISMNVNGVIHDIGMINRIGVAYRCRGCGERYVVQRDSNPLYDVCSCQRPMNTRT